MSKKKHQKLSIAHDDVGTIVEPRSEPDILAPAFSYGAGSASVSLAHTAKLRADFRDAIGDSGMQVIPASGSELILRGFIGYGRLQQLSQDSIMRLLIQTRTDEMVRKWITIKADDAERVKKLDESINEIGLRKTLQHAVSVCGFMGGAYIYVDTGTKNPVDPLNWSESSAELQPGKTLAFRVIDPLWTTPQKFNAVDPLAEDYFRPSVFLVMGRPVHRSRLIRIVENEVLDILKPAYNFLGIAQSQLLEDYVRDFRDNREAVNRLLKKFSSSFLKLKMDDWLYAQGSRAQVDKRIKDFVRWRTNDGVSVLDRETEDFAQVNTPLSGVDALLSQSLQFCVAVNRTNVVKTLGISPAGFNTGDSDIKVHNDLIAAQQEKVLRRPIEMLLKALSLHLFGSAEPVPFDFNPLNEEDAREIADTEKIEADTTAIYLDRGVITPDEARAALQKSDSALAGCIEGDLPDAPEDDPFAALTQQEPGNGAA